MSGVEGLAGSTEAHEDKGLVPVVGDEAVIGLLSSGKDVRRHVLSTATVEHLQYLEGEEGGAERWGKEVGPGGAGR